jgi:YceI-like domain
MLFGQDISIARKMKNMRLDGTRNQGGSMLSWLKMAGMLAFVGMFWANAYAGGGELIVFTGDAKNPVERDFKEKYLPQIKEIAKAQGVTVIEKAIAKGAPDAVHFTPSMYFQNHLGRSLFLGRYQSMDKVKTFLRTVSRQPQGEISNEKHDVLVWQHERMRVFSPIKFTPLDGVIPPGFDQAAFHREALAALAKGANSATLQALFSAQRNDRAMYLALYPYHGTDGKFFLSAEMYAQFNCIEPIMKRFDNPFEGTFNAWQKVVVEAGAALQAEVAKQLASTTRGDGLLPVPTKTPTKSWEDLGLHLPKAPSGVVDVAANNILIVQDWEYAGPVEPGSPVLSFSFLAPLDNYAGEIKTLFGTLKFGDGPTIDNTVGKFGIETSSLTMGDAGLDSHVKEMIAMAEHPQAFFTFLKVMSLEQPKIAFGAVTQFVAQGQLDFMGVQAPVDVTTQLEPVLDEQGAVRISVSASFSLHLKDKYNLDGPDGPMPAKDTMQFFLNFLLKPKA